MNISGEVVRTSQLPKKTLGLNDSLVALMSSPLETVTVPVSDFVSFVATQLLTASADSLDSVTTVGNTTANTITIGGATSPYYQLNTLSPGTQAVGRFVWNDTDGTADLRLKGGNVTLQIGQETVVRVVNKTNTNLLESEYKVVRVRIASEGGAQGQRLAVVLAQGNNDPDSVTTLGIVTENINNNQEGFITVFGNVSGINTTGSLQGETWADGDVLFLSPTTPGALTKVKPVAPNHTVVMGYVVYAHQNNGKIFVKVDNGYELEELHDVLPTPYVNNGVLYRDTTANLWRSATISTLLGYTPSNASGTTNYISKFTGTNTLGNSLIYDNGTNVGIGTTTPASRLTVLNPSNTVAALIGGGAAAPGWVGLGTVNSGALPFIQGYNNAVSGTVPLSLNPGGSNVLIGTATDAGYKLDVNGTARIQGTTTITPAANTSAIASTGYSVTGSGTTPLVDLSGTWNTTGAPTLIKANVTDTASNASSFLIDLQVAGSSQFRVRKDGYARASQGFVIGTSNGNDLVSSSGGESYAAGGLFTSLRFASTSTEGYGLTISGFNASTRTNTSGGAGILQLAHGFAPTSGFGTFIGLLYRGTINQTGGASGVTRGLYVNPTLTAAADWRSIEWSNNTGWGLFGAGSASNYLGGSLVIGTTTVNASALLQVESTTKGFLPPRMTTAQILLISSPAEGLQVYNTDLKTICFYNGTAWQRVTSTAM